MNISGDLNHVLDATAKILIRCVLMNLVVIVLWWCFFMISRGHGLQTLIFNLTPHEVALVTHCGIAFVKLCNIMFFLVPYIAIRWVLKVRESQETTGNGSV